MNKKALWKSSDWPYDPKAKLIKIDGKYDVFLRYSDDVLKPSKSKRVSGSAVMLPGSASGNVITIHPNLRAEAGALITDSIVQHEAQHVIQYYEVENSDVKYNENPLFYEKEACARQLLHGPRNNQIDQSIIINLVKNGMDEVEAWEWLLEVDTSGKYSGVNSPRIAE